MEETYDWRYFGKIAASIALSVIIALFWISNYQKSPKLNQNPENYNLGSVFADKLTNRTLVFFWASWCESCKEDLQELRAFTKSNLPEGFSVLAVNIDETKNLPAARFIWSQFKIEGVELLFDTSREIQKNLSVDILPSYFLFDKEGKTQLRLDGNINLKDEKLLSLLFE